MWYASVADVLGTRQSELRIEQRKTTELQREAGTLDKLKKEEEKLRAKAEIVDIIDKLRADPSRVMMQLAQHPQPCLADRDVLLSDRSTFGS